MMLTLSWQKVEKKKIDTWRQRNRDPVSMGSKGFMKLIIFRNEFYNSSIS